MEASNMGFMAGGESVPAPVGSAYCVQKLTRFVMDPKLEICDPVTIRDAQGSIVFSEKKKMIRNGANQPVASIKRKLFSFRGKWKAYNGNNLLFTMVRSSFFQQKASYDIFLPGNRSSSSDFTVKRDHSKHNFTVSYKNATIAEIQRKGRRGAFFHHYDVIVQPGIDYAFVLFILMIIEKKEPRRQAAGSSNPSLSASLTEREARLLQLTIIFAAAAIIM